MDLSPADLQTLALAAACHRQASLDVLINDDESESNTLLTVDSGELKQCLNTATAAIAGSQLRPGALATTARGDAAAP